jgi:hypothetical protein
MTQTNPQATRDVAERAREIFARELEAEADACGPWTPHCSARWQGSKLRGRAKEVRNLGYLDADDALTLRTIEAALTERLSGAGVEDWVVQAAIYNSRDAGDPLNFRDPEGVSVEHAAWMLYEIINGTVSGRKAHRWLGYAQGILVMSGRLTLEQAKLANKRASDEAALSAPARDGEGLTYADGLEAIARDLIDQDGEPWISGTDADRLHYWRDKAIKAAAAIRKLAALPRER